MYQVILQSKIVLLALHIYCFEMRSSTGIAVVCPLPWNPQGWEHRELPRFLFIMFPDLCSFHIDLHSEK